MIIRKPYAFLIKNFKKIHVFLLAFSIYIFFKSTQTYSFIREFISLSTYDRVNEPITKYASFISVILIIILIAGSLAIMLLLRKKDKPWKLYLVPTIQYTIILLAFLSARSFFNSYTGTESTTALRVWRDILLISQISQFGVIIIYIIRVFGIDLNKFNFKLDEEYLELDQSDKEELEISINIDKSSFKRTYKRLLRNLNYFYQEHKILSHLIIIIFVLIIGKNTISYIVSHRSYKQGDTFNINSYQVKINNSYYSDKSYNGTVISKKSSFVIVDISIKNIANTTREVDLNKYHIMNGISNYSPTEKTYETEFQDLGKAYDSVSLKPNDQQRLLLIYKVDKKLKSNSFVLYYQELNQNTKFLRKIKLNIKDLSNIKIKSKLNLGDTITLNIDNKEENINFEDYNISEQVSYNYKICKLDNCNGTQTDYKEKDGYKILTIIFGSDTYEGKEMSNFVENYGKIIYKNKNGKKKTIKVTNSLRRTYYGKYLYLTIPNEAATSDTLEFEFIIRNKKFIYKIK